MSGLVSRIVDDDSVFLQDAVVSFGPEMLSRFPNLHTFQIYKCPPRIEEEPKYPQHLFDPTYPTIQEELRNLVIPWNRYCPTLREVQLSVGYKAVRGAQDGAWFVEKIKLLEEREDFNY